MGTKLIVWGENGDWILDAGYWMLDTGC